LTQEDLAGILYDSLQNKIKSLPDDVIVYPGHGAGSACGKNMSKETFDTLGNQKQKNYALIMNSKTDFVKELTAGIMPPPQYFAKNAQLNKMGYSEFDSVLQKGYTALSPQQVEDLANNENALILDVRKPGEFAESHVPNSIFIGIDGQFAPWVGALIKDLQQPIVLLAPAGREQEIITRLSRVGYDNCLGYLEGGIDAWKNAGKETSNVISISAQEFSDKIKSGINTIDVRKPGEYDSQHVENVPNQPLDFINDWTDTLDKSKTYHIHCAGGYRSMIAASILKARGFEKLVDVTGGFSAIEKTNAPLTCAKTCASKNV
jgi:rhodanese-related sulfurtransferase